MVATLDDKMSWIAAPTVFILPSHYSIGAGYAESNLGGENKKMLLYAQYGNLTSLVLGTFLDPAIHGSKWETRFDIYLLHQITDEYSNVDPRSFAIERESTETFLDAGALVGYRFAWWLVGETPAARRVRVLSRLATRATPRRHRSPHRRPTAGTSRCKRILDARSSQPSLRRDVGPVRAAPARGEHPR